MDRIKDFLIEISAGFDCSVNESCTNTVGGANDCFECCSNRYFNDSNAINYSCTQFQRAYVMRYLPVHIKENLLAYKLIPKEILREIGKTGKVNMISLGGGPGSDIAAFKMFLRNYKRHVPQINHALIYRIDKEETWDTLASRILYLEDCQDIEIIHKKRTQNVLELKQLRNNVKFDFISLSYLLSELEPEDIPCLAENISGFVADTSVIIINDRDQSKVWDIADSLIYTLNANLLASDTDVHHCGINYPDDLREILKPKLNTTSKRCVAMIKNL